jgi:hypothetical protein
MGNTDKLNALRAKRGGQAAHRAAIGEPLEVGFIDDGIIAGRLPR